MNDAQRSSGSEQPNRGPDIEKPWRWEIWVTCGGCNRTWMAAPLPIAIDVMVRMMKHLKHCPVCGHGKIYVAKDAAIVAALNAMLTGEAREPNAGSKTRDAIASAPESSLPESNNQSETP